MVAWSGRSKDKLVRMDVYPSDYLLDEKTIPLTEEEHGVYWLLLLWAWHGDGSLPSDTNALARLLRGGRPVFDRCWPAVSQFFVEKDGRLFNPRMQRERTAALKNKRSKSDGGSKGNAKRWKPGSVSDRLAIGERSGFESPDPNRSEPEPEPGTPTGVVSGAVAPAPEPPQKRPRKALAAPPTDAEPPAPTRDLIAHWQACDRKDGIEPNGQYGPHAKILKQLWLSCGKDVSRAIAAIDAFRACRSAFQVEQGHTVTEFGRTMPRWIREANGTAPTATPRGRLADMDAASERVLKRWNGTANGNESDGMLYLEESDHVPTD